MITSAPLAATTGLQPKPVQNRSSGLTRDGGMAAIARDTPALRVLSSVWASLNPDCVTTSVDRVVDRSARNVAAAVSESSCRASSAAIERAMSPSWVWVVAVGTVVAVVAVVVALVVLIVGAIVGAADRPAGRGIMQMPSWMYRFGAVGSVPQDPDR